MDTHHIDKLSKLSQRFGELQLKTADKSGGHLSDHSSSDTSSDKTLNYLLGNTTSPVSIWATAATGNVFDGPEPAWKDSRVELSGARGERVSFQIGIESQASLPGLELSLACSRFDVRYYKCDPLKIGPQVVSLDSLGEAGDTERARVGCALSPSCATLRRIRPPDALTPCPWGARITLDTDKLGLWMSIDIPEDQPPGIYLGVLTVVGHFTAMTASEASARLNNAAEDASQTAKESDDPEKLKACLNDTSSCIKKVTKQLDHGSRMLLPETKVIAIEVLGFTLPRTPSFPILAGISEQVIEKRYQVEKNTDAWRNQMVRHYKMILGYRMSPYFIRRDEDREDVRSHVTYSCPYPLDSDKADQFLNDPDMARYVVPFSVSEWMEDAEKDTSKGDAEKDATEGDPEKEAETDPAMVTPAVIRELQKKPHFEKAIFFLMDEPTTTSDFEELAKVSKKIQAEIPGACVLSTFFSGPSDAPDKMEKGKKKVPTNFESMLSVPGILKGSTMIYCVSEWALGTSPEAAQHMFDAIQMGTEADNAAMWTYVCMGPGNPQPNWHLNMNGGQHRAVAWRSFMENSSGMLYWGVNCCENNATNPKAPIVFREGHPPGDGVLIYSGERYGAGTNPIASMRLERALLGFQDVEYMMQHAAAFGRESTEKVIQKLAYRSPTEFTMSNTETETMRRMLAREIIAGKQDDA